MQQIDYTDQPQTTGYSRQKTRGERWRNQTGFALSQSTPRSLCFYSFVWHHAQQKEATADRSSSQRSTAHHSAEQVVFISIYNPFYFQSKIYLHHFLPSFPFNSPCPAQFVASFSLISSVTYAYKHITMKC